MRDPRTGRFLSRAQAAALEAATTEKGQLIEQLAAVENRLTEISNSGIDIPELVREVVKSILIPIIREYGFDPAELVVEKPTPIDPIVKYQGETIAWWL